MNRTVVIPGPETVVWWGVSVPVLAAIFGIAGVLLGHLIAPVPATPLPIQRQLGGSAACVLLSLGITITTGQRPLIVLSWSIGIGFAGITIFQTMASQAASAFKRGGDALVAEVTERLGGKGGDA